MKTFLMVCLGCAMFIADATFLADTALGQVPVSLPEIKPPTFEGKTKELALPAQLSDVKVGGGGRYIVLEMKSLRKLAILDVNEAKLVGYIPLADDSTQFAAGATKLIMVSSDSGVISRWDLATQNKELTQTIDLGGPIKHLLLGSSSNGPAIAATASSHRGVPYSVDLTTLETEKLVIGSMHRGFSDRANVRMAANGTAMGAWESGVSPSGLQTYVKIGEKWEVYYEHESVGHIVPSPDGRMVYTAAGSFTNQLRALGSSSGVRPHFGSAVAIPAVHGPFALAVSGGEDFSSSRDKKPEKVSLLLEGDERPLVDIPDLVPVFENREARFARDGFSLDKKLMFVPDAHLIVQVPADRSKVVLVKFNHEEQLKQSESNFLIVRSRPPLSIKAGEKLSYQVQTLANSSDLSFSLDSAPEGMELSESGLLTWSTSAKSPRTCDVIISVSDEAGQQIYHTFNLDVVGGKQGADSGMGSVGAAADVAPIKTTPAKLESARKEIRLPSTIESITPGGGGRYLFAHLPLLKKIAVIDVSQGKIVQFLPASDDNTLVTAGATRALVFNLSQGVVSRYRLDTLERELTTTIPFANAIQFAAMGANSEGPVMLRTSVGNGALDGCSFHFLDINTMKPVEVVWRSGRPLHAVYRDQNHIQASSNGSVYCVQGIGCVRLNGGSVTFSRSSSYSRGLILPSPNGERFIANGTILSQALEPVGNQSDSYGMAVPSITGNYFISFSHTNVTSSRNSADRLDGKLYMFGESRPLTTIKDLLPVPANPHLGNQALHHSIYFVPDAQVIAVRAKTNDRIDLLSFDVDDALNESGVDYLLVDSQAPSQAELNSLYEYAISVKSKRGGVEYQLDSAPEGMQISPEGVITWQVPKALHKADHHVIVSVSDDSGQNTFHTFSVTIPDVEEQLQRAASKERAAAKGLAANEAAEAEQQALDKKGVERAMSRRQPNNAREGLSKIRVPDAAVEHKFRVWTDSTGKHKIEGQFVRIDSKKEVFIKLKSGETKRVPLDRLSTEDIYEAVKMDLLSQGQIEETKSPFQ